MSPHEQFVHRLISALSLVGIFAASFSLAGCKASIGDVCRCDTDCKSDLMCVDNTNRRLSPDIRVPDANGDGTHSYCEELRVGQCVATDREDDGETAEVPSLITRDDLPSRRDLGGGETETETETETSSDSDSGSGEDSGSGDGSTSSDSGSGSG